MENYVILSIETHLFFARIMKEHALFLEAGFPCKEEAWIKKADWFREEFENLLRDTLSISDGRINRCITESDELVTKFTIPAEKRTVALSGIPINSELSVTAQNLHSLSGRQDFRRMIPFVHRLNERALRLLNGLIDFKENILREVANCRLFTTNYPLLIKHILREAKLYRATIEELMQNKRPSYKNLRKTEDFWNQIMMEHALFIRGLLDPCEEQLIDTADNFSKEYCELLEQACCQDTAAAELAESSLNETLKYKEFKEAGTDGILNGKIDSIILPLLADHILREANHYIRLLECDKTTSHSC